MHSSSQSARKVYVVDGKEIVATPVAPAAAVGLAAATVPRRRQEWGESEAVGWACFPFLGPPRPFFGSPMSVGLALDILSARRRACLRWSHLTDFQFAVRVSCLLLFISPLFCSQNLRINEDFLSAPRARTRPTSS